MMRGVLVVGALCVGSLAAASSGGTKEPAFLEGYKSDAKAKAIAQTMFEKLGHVATVGADEIMDGGYRGKIHLVPQLPTGTYRQQLVWVSSAMFAIDAFYSALATKDAAPNYRWKNIELRFVRSVGKRTPSAYATQWSITHNVVGSLLTSERGVLETYVHEMFHLNDFDHGDWSGKTLTADYKAIIKKCGQTGAKAVKCLAPFAPNDTKVRASGTYYAFQPGNGDSVHEYAAELAVRYFKEQTAIRDRGALDKPAFKCGPPENARAWKALVDEFFAGQDRVPACE